MKSCILKNPDRIGNGERFPAWLALCHKVFKLFRLAEPKIGYVPLKRKDWLWLPWALLIYPVHFLHVRLADTALPLALRQAMHPFQSLLSPHYIIICEKASG